MTQRRAPRHLLQAARSPPPRHLSPTRTAAQPPAPPRAPAACAAHRAAGTRRSAIRSCACATRSRAASLLVLRVKLFVALPRRAHFAFGVTVALLQRLAVCLLVAVVAA
eukprot:TRINITY_DN1089_c0_g1_i4.p2 TRINITY_DN1089_c0_g1~~TRINITY_DN1089_c0_g1_i4.p2  ORF type:complete len:109 (-),score=24.87 TRINITY_DN1089_c0_g1_i4:519-845(-)